MLVYRFFWHWLDIFCWVIILQGAKAQRVEYLLLHAFHAKKYIVPDKSIGMSKSSISTKRRLANVDVENRNNLHTDEHNEQVKSKKGPAYAGGLVLEPKKGLYDKFVLLLDFNSLYPSIIQVVIDIKVIGFQVYDYLFSMIEHVVV